jgi:glycosyltransferase involved in cell wall biosynthesis
MAGLRVLITNNALARRAGTELYTRDLALGLLERGHTPVVFSTVLGEVAQELRAATVAVISDLNALAVTPDIIHGQHHMEAMMALLHFPDVPAVHFCHGWLPWQESPPHFPRIIRYVAVDYTCRDRLILENGIPEEKVNVLLNFVDLERFKPRDPLPARPARGLLFSNYANSETHLPIVREAAAHTGITLDVVGVGVGKSCAEPEKLLGGYDIVFAKARAALEAMAVGTAVVLCDASGIGTMVTSGEFERLRALNFGVRALREPLNAERLVREIERYDPLDAAEVSRKIRASAGRDAALDELIGLYEEVIAEYKSRRDDECDARAEGRAAAAYLRQLMPKPTTAHSAATSNLRERVRRIPLVGKVGVRLARMLYGSKAK